MRIFPLKELPKNISELYSKFIDLFLNKWDKGKGISEQYQLAEKEFILKAQAKIQSGWHLYGQYIEEGGPSPTAFTFKNTPKKFELVGKTTEEKGHETIDKIFDMKIKYFEDKAVFTQKIKVTSDVSSITADVDFMVCDDSNCLPPTTEELTFKIPAEKKLAF